MNGKIEDNSYQLPFKNAQIYMRAKINKKMDWINCKHNLKSKLYHIMNYENTNFWINISQIVHIAIKDKTQLW